MLRKAILFPVLCATILAQDPPPKAQGIERPSVNLLVSAEDSIIADGFVMPDLTGLPIVAAQSALSRVGIKFSEPRFQDVSIPPVSSPPASPNGYAPIGSPAPVPALGPAPAPARATALPGAVLSQSPPAGYRVDVGTTVSLTVAK